MPPRGWARIIVFGAILIGIVTRWWVVANDDGIFWPDEVYQSFEPAHWLVFGHGLMPWEYIDGARTWALPGLIALVLKLSAVFGGTSPTIYVPLVKGLFAAASVGASLGVFRLVRVLAGIGPTETLAAAAASALWVLNVASLYFASRAMSENAAAATVVWGLALVLERGASRRGVALGASLLGMAVLFRLQAAIFCAGALAMLLWRARTEPAPWRLVLGVLAGWAVAMGLLDAATWHAVPGARFGGLYHSVLVYVRFNLVENRGAQWGVEPWTFYGRVLWGSMPAVTALCAVGLVASARKAPGIAAMVLVFLGFHAWVAHKEYRFVMPVLPVWCAAAGVGIAQLSRIRLLRPLVPVMVLVGLASTLGARSLTMGDLGAYPERPASSAWDDFGSVNRLLLAASKRDDVCGMRVDAAHLAWTGGSTYLHHKAPLYMSNTPASTRFFNYAIVRRGSGAEVIASDHGLELVHLPLECAPDEHYSWRLP